MSDADTWAKRVDELESRREEMMLAGNGRGSMDALEQAILLTIDSDDETVTTRGLELLGRKASSLNAMRAYHEAAREFDRMVDIAERAAEPTRSVRMAIGLTGRAITLAGLLRYDQAISAFAVVVDRFGDDPRASVRAEVAHALFNRAILIRDSGSDDPVPAFDAVIRFVRASPLPELEQWEALALINKAGHLVTLGELPAAVDIYQEIGDRFTTSSSDVARLRAARAIRLRAVQLVETGDTEDAITGFRDAVGRFAGAPQPAIRAEAAEALLTMCRLLVRLQRGDEAAAASHELEVLFGDDPDPAVREVAILASAGQVQRAAHALDDPMARSTYLEIREGMLRLVLAVVGLAVAGIVAVAAVLLLRPVRRYLVATAIAVFVVVQEFKWWRRLRNLATDQHAHVEHMNGEDRAQARSDEEARHLLAEHEETGSPYALFLRSFDIEGTRKLTDVDGSPMWVAIARPNLRGIEPPLQEGLAAWVPLLGLQNPADTITRLKGGIPKLALPVDGWREVVRGLVAGAELLVIQPVEWSPGVSAELSIILQEGRAADTVVIAAGATENDVEFTNRLVDMMTKKSAALKYDPPPGIPEFARVVREDELDVNSLGSHPLFADLLDRIEFLRGLDPHRRREARDARRNFQDAVRNAGHNESTAALRRLQELRRVQQRLGDRIGLIRTLQSIGIIQYSAGDLAGASALFEEALARCIERDLVSRGPVRRLLAACQRKSGDLDGAVATLRLAVDDLSVGGSQAELISALGSLAELTTGNGNAAEGADLLERAVALKRAASEDAALSHWLLMLGSSQLAAARNQDAIGTFGELLDLIDRFRSDSAATAIEPVAFAMLAVASHRVGDIVEAQRLAGLARAGPVSDEYVGAVSHALRIIEDSAGSD